MLLFVYYRLSYYHALRAKGIPTKLMMFPEDVHAIDRPFSEAEQWVAIADWIRLHLK
jgi:acylaminoacyl-peptidase